MGDQKEKKSIGIIKFVLSLGFSLLIFLWSLDLMTTTFQFIGNQTVTSLLDIIANPFVSLFIGLFITAVIQSSSTSTSLIVAIVASGSLSLQNAVPMIMGANIGTTLTSTIVSLSYITNNKEFKNAIATGVMHDFFNIMTVLILFPLEWKYQILSNLSIDITNFFGFESPKSTLTNTVNTGYFRRLNNYILSITAFKPILILLSTACLLGSIKIISKTISNRLIGTTQEKFELVFFKNKFSAFSLGAILTGAIQSSSISTTIIVPLGATGKIKLPKLYPYIIGANVGTTITALIAALNKSEAAMNIALVHFLFNLIGAFVFLLIPGVNRLPIIYAKKFGNMTMQYKIIGFFYVLFIFFVLPLSLIFLDRLL
ncbi:Na/Pi symporter [Reichenbachiella agarivorans]|uniref:Na/Pi symporter n=1 Tax=Reichenbachiella agarivorans TaxID=2979464 RepID=A0ABY6CK80_9BACT|nr:Na/Pi symporter [Reichenbachiella agarivorans]UXP30932.1 Na/Pi symporter [Reichenbachiella agarivorans]